MSIEFYKVYNLCTWAEILQSIPNQVNYLFPTKEQECQNIELMENENFYLEIHKETNVFYRFSNNFQELVSDKWNLKFIDFISQVELAPDYFSILQSQYLILDDGKCFCSLLQNLRNLDYSIYCKDVMVQQQIEYQAKFSEILEFSFFIIYQKGIKCNSFLFFNNLFYILCIIEDQMQIITFDMKGNKQQYNYTISSQQCNFKFQHIQSFSFIVALYQCINWEILIFEYSLQGLKRITNQEIYLKAQSNSNKYLQDLFVCQENLYLIFDHEYFQLKILSLLFPDVGIDASVYIDKIQNLDLLILLSCKYENQQISEYTINSIQTNFELKNLKTIMKIGPYLTFLIYSDHLIAMLTKEITQKIHIEINQFCNLQQAFNYFLIVDKQNKISLFEINLFQNYFSYQSNLKYVGFYTIKETTVMLLRCFAITQYGNSQNKLKSQIESLKNQNYMIQIDDNFDNIKIEKSHFFLKKNLQFRFIFPNIFQPKIEQNETNLQCNINRKQLNLTSKFFIFKINSQNYLMFNKKELLAIYHCNTQNFSYFNFKIDLNSIKIYFALNFQLALVQETEGRIITIQLQKKQDQIQYQIHQFKEQIKISFTYRNLLIIQLQNSKQLFFQHPEENTFLNQSLNNLRYFNNYSNFQESIKDAINVLNFNNIFIFQYESYLIIQVEQIVTQTINQKMILLGGFQKRSQPLQIILIGTNYEMNRIDKYLITKVQFFKISTFYFQDYFPIQPLQYQIHEDNLIITTEQLNTDQFHIMLFFINQENRLEYYEIISTPYQYFYAISGILYYYDKNQELIEYNIKYFSFDFDLQDLNQIAYNLQFQIDIINPYSQINKYIYSEQLNLLVLNLQENLQLINQSNPTIILNNNQAILNPNKFVHGIVSQFHIQNNIYFTLQSPFKIVSQKKCLDFHNNVCIFQSDPQLIVQDLTKSIEQNQTYSIRITEYFKIHCCDDGLIIIQQIDQQNIKIQYFKKDIETFIFIKGTLINNQIKQQILMIQTNEFINFYFIDEDIKFIYSCILDTSLTNNFLFYQIDTDKICQILIEFNYIKIQCFQIKQGVSVSISNYTVPILDIYNQINLSHYLPDFTHEARIQILNLTSTLQNVLDFKIAVNYKRQYFRYHSILLFYVQITLKNQEYQIKLNNIIRLPKFNANCSPLLLQNNLLFLCQQFHIILYQLQNEFQVLDPYAVIQFSGEFCSILNNTHLALYNSIKNEVTIIEIDFWRLVKNNNISVEDEQNVTFIVQNHLSQLEFKVNVVNQRKLENYLNFIRVGIIVINSVFIQIIIIINKQRRI